MLVAANVMLNIHLLRMRRDDSYRAAFFYDLIERIETFNGQRGEPHPTLTKGAETLRASSDLWLGYQKNAHYMDKIEDVIEAIRADLESFSKNDQTWLYENGLLKFHP